MAAQIEILISCTMNNMDFDRLTDSECYLCGLLDIHPSRWLRMSADQRACLVAMHGGLYDASRWNEDEHLAEMNAGCSLYDDEGRDEYRRRESLLDDDAYERRVRGMR